MTNSAPLKVLAFAASNSKQSINKMLVQYAGGLLPNAEVELLDLNDYELPLYSVDREAELDSPPALAQAFFNKITQADAVLISYAEHNASYTAAYKNMFDWASRIDAKVFQNKPMVLLATSPGPGGARNVLATAKTSAPYFGGQVMADFSVPSFYKVFDAEKRCFTDSEIEKQLQQAMHTLVK